MMGLLIWVAFAGMQNYVKNSVKYTVKQFKLYPNKATEKFVEDTSVAWHYTQTHACVPRPFVTGLYYPGNYCSITAKWDVYLSLSAKARKPAVNKCTLAKVTFFFCYIFIMKADIMKRGQIKENLLENISDMNVNIYGSHFCCCCSSMDMIKEWCSQKDLAKILQ